MLDVRKNNLGTLYFDQSIMKESFMYMDDVGGDVSEQYLFLFEQNNYKTKTKSINNEPKFFLTNNTTLLLFSNWFFFPAVARCCFELNHFPRKRVNWVINVDPIFN